MKRTSFLGTCAAEQGIAAFAVLREKVSMQYKGQIDKDLWLTSFATGSSLSLDYDGDVSSEWHPTPGSNPPGITEEATAIMDL